MCARPLSPRTKRSGELECREELERDNSVAEREVPAIGRHFLDGGVPQARLRVIDTVGLQATRFSLWRLQRPNLGPSALARRVRSGRSLRRTRRLAGQPEDPVSRESSGAPAWSASTRDRNPALDAFRDTNPNRVLKDGQDDVCGDNSNANCDHHTQHLLPRGDTRMLEAVLTGKPQIAAGLDMPRDEPAYDRTVDPGPSAMGMTLPSSIRSRLTTRDVAKQTIGPPSDMSSIFHGATVANIDVPRHTPRSDRRSPQRLLASICD